MDPDPAIHTTQASSYTLFGWMQLHHGLQGCSFPVVRVRVIVRLDLLSCLPSQTVLESSFRLNIAVPCSVFCAVAPSLLVAIVPSLEKSGFTDPKGPLAQGSCRKNVDASMSSSGLSLSSLSYGHAFWAYPCLQHLLLKNLTTPTQPNGQTQTQNAVSKPTQPRMFSLNPQHLQPFAAVYFSFHSSAVRTLLCIQQLPCSLQRGLAANIMQPLANTRPSDLWGSIRGSRASLSANKG